MQSQKKKYRELPYKLNEKHIKREKLEHSETKQKEEKEPLYIVIDWTILAPVVSEWTLYETYPVKRYERYEKYRTCCNSECWYSGNLDRLEELKEMHYFENDYSLCDVCIHNIEWEAILPKEGSVEFDISRFSKELQEKLVALAENEMKS